MQKELQDIQNIKNSLMSKLTKSTLQNEHVNFNKFPAVQGSSVITLNTVPKNNRISSEDSSTNFSKFAYHWKDVNATISTIDSINNDLNENNTTGTYIVATRIKCSENGSYQIAATSNGPYLSLDSGHSFVATDILESIIDVTISASGHYLTCSSSTDVYTSKDFGNTWLQTSLEGVISLDISADGQIHYAASHSLHISVDYGTTWQELLSENIRNVKCSASGQYVTIIKEDNTVWYSNSYATTFKQSNCPTHVWFGLAVSTTGQYQTIFSNMEETVFTSDDYGKSWFNTETNLYDTLTDISMVGSGKYQLMSGSRIYMSKNYGHNWFSIDVTDSNILCVSTSTDGKVSMLCSDRIYTSTISNNYIQESGVVIFQKLDESLLGTDWTLQNTNMDFSESRVAHAMSKTGQYQTILVDNSVWTSSDYGGTYTENSLISVLAVSISDNGQYQSICSSTDIYRSDDYGYSFNACYTADCVDIKISMDGRYQTACGAKIVYSYDYGLTWTEYSQIENLKSLCMSADGHYQTVLANDKIYTTSTYGMRWSEGMGIYQKIACSSSGQYQSVISTSGIKISDDYGLTWIDSISGTYSCIVVSNSGQYQLITEEEDSIYLSKDYGTNWSVCYQSNKQWLALSLSKTLQYITAINKEGIVTSNISGSIPGQVTVSTEYTPNINATILLSGNSNRIYSYAITNEFNIVSSDINDDSYVSYCILDYGEEFN